MWKVLFLGMAFSLLSPLPVLADWEYTQWGMTPDQVISAAKGDVKLVPPANRLTINGVNRQNAVDGSFADGDLRLAVTFQFDTVSSGLLCVHAEVIDMAQNTLLRDRLIKKHGQPQEKSGLPAIGLEEYHWKAPDIIRLELLEGARYAATQCKPGHEI